MDRILIAVEPLLKDLHETFTDLVKNYPNNEDLLQELDLATARIVKEQPTVNKDGSWLLTVNPQHPNDVSDCQIVCTTCGKPIAPKYRYKNGAPYYELPDFCPHCGSRNNHE